MKSRTFKGLCGGLVGKLIGVDILCLFTSVTFAAINSSSFMLVFVQLLNFIVVITTVYPSLHKFGDSDSPLTQAGVYKRQPFKGLLAGLVADIPFLASWLVLVMSKITGMPDNFVSIYKLINAFYFPLNSVLMPVDALTSDISAAVIVGELLVLMIIPLISMMSYMLGLNRFSFNEFVFYKKTTR